MRISTIAAVASNGVIGKDNDLVWSLPADMKFFMSTTKGHVVITGRKNYESIPEAYRPLRGRTNVVITRNLDYVAEGAEVVHSLEEALSVARLAGETECFVIGGGQIYGQALKEGLVDTQYITHVEASPEGDAFYPSGAWDGWPSHELHEQPADERHDHGFRIVQYNRSGT
jgi:dihydrofolate reductase